MFPLSLVWYHFLKLNQKLLMHGIEVATHRISFVRYANFSGNFEVGWAFWYLMKCLHNEMPPQSSLYTKIMHCTGCNDFLRKFMESHLLFRSDLHCIVLWLLTYCDCYGNVMATAHVLYFVNVTLVHRPVLMFCGLVFCKSLDNTSY